MFLLVLAFPNDSRIGDDCKSCSSNRISAFDRLDRGLEDNGLEGDDDDDDDDDDANGVMALCDLLTRYSRMILAVSVLPLPDSPDITTD